MSTTKRAISPAGSGNIVDHDAPHGASTSADGRNVELGLFSIEPSPVTDHPSTSMRDSAATAHKPVAGAIVNVQPLKRSEMQVRRPCHAHPALLLTRHRYIILYYHLVTTYQHIII
jgi:hypothetical protein